MTILYIQPIVYTAQRLPEIGERIVAAFPSLLEGYVLRPNMVLSEEERKIILHRNEKSNHSKRQISDWLGFSSGKIPPIQSQPPQGAGVFFRNQGKLSTPNVDATRLLEFLALGDVPCLGITSFLSREDVNRHWGKSSFDQRTAYLATGEEEFETQDTDIHVERVVIEGLHELGHVFGLDHHEGVELTASQKYCPMTVVHETVASEGTITWGEYISLRDSTSFCDDCTKELTKEKVEQKLKEAHRRLFQRLF